MKKKTNITIDSNVAEMLEEYLINNKIGNRSKFMKHIKTYKKSTDKLEKGDYVLLDGEKYVEYEDSIVDKILQFVSTTVGQYVKKLSTKQADVALDWVYVIQYDVIPDDLKLYFNKEGKYLNCRRSSRSKIVKYSKSKEELEINLMTKKYNL